MRIALALLGVAALCIFAPFARAGDDDAQSLDELVQRLVEGDPDERAEVIKKIASFGRDAVPPLRRALDHESTEAQCAAADAIVALGPQAKRAVPKLVERLQSDSVPVRVHVARALGATRSEDGLKALLGALDDEHEDVGDAAAKALTVLGKKHESAVNALLEIVLDLKRDDGFGRMALAKIGQHAIPQIRRALVASEGAARVRLFDMLIMMGTEAMEVTPDLVEMLRSDDEVLVTNVKGVLKHICPSTASTITSLHADLRGGDEAARIRAAHTLGVIRPFQPETLGALIEAIGDKVAEVRAAVVEAVGNLGGLARDAAPRLCKVLEDDTLAISREAADALAKIGKEEPSVAELVIPLLEDALAVGDLAQRALLGMGSAPLPEFSKALGETSGRTRFRLLHVISALDEGSALVIPILLDMIESSDLDTRNSASKALERVGEESVPGLIQKLKHDVPGVRAIVVSTLGALGAAAEPARPKIVSVMKDKDRQVRRNAAEALGAMGRPDKATIAALIKALTDKEPIVQYAAATSLGQVGASDTRVPRALAKRLKDDDKEVRWTSAEALGALGASAESAVTALCKVLAIDIQPEVRFRVARAIGQIGVVSKRVLSALQGGLIDDNVNVRVESAKALGALGAASMPLVDNIERLFNDESPRVQAAARDAVARIKAGS